MKSAKRFLALLLFVLMLIGMLPNAAFAVEGNEPENAATALEQGEPVEASAEDETTKPPVDLDKEEIDDDAELEAAVATGKLVITKTFKFVDDEDQEIAPDPTCLESFEMTVSAIPVVVDQKKSTAKDDVVPTVTYDASQKKFVSNDGSTVEQLNEGFGYKWTLELTPGEYLIEEFDPFGYTFDTNEWILNSDVSATKTHKYELEVIEGETDLQVVNKYQREYGCLLVAKVILGLGQVDKVSDLFPDDKVMFTITGPSDFGTNGKMDIYFKDFLKDDQDNYKFNFSSDLYSLEHHNQPGLDGYLYEGNDPYDDYLGYPHFPGMRVPCGLYTVVEDENTAQIEGYDLTVSYMSGYSITLKKSAARDGEGEEPELKSNQTLIQPYVPNRYVEYGGVQITNTYSTSGTIQITKKFAGLEKGVFPAKYEMRLEPNATIEAVDDGDDDGGEAARKAFVVIDDDSVAKYPYVYYDSRAGRFELGGILSDDYTLQQTADGFIWTLNDYPTGDYILAEDPGWVGGYKWNGAEVTVLGETIPAADSKDTKEVELALFKLGAKETKAITVTNNYEQVFGYLKITKDLDENSLDVTIPDGTTFTIRDEDGNIAKDADGKDAVLKYKDFIEVQGNEETGKSYRYYLVKLPAGIVYTVEESNAEVEGYAVTAWSELIDPFEAVAEHPIDPPGEAARSVEGNAKSVSTIVEYRDFYVGEEYDEAHPIEVHFHNKYTDRFGTLTITKIVTGVTDDDLILNGAYTVGFWIYPVVAARAANDEVFVETSDFTRKEENGKVYYESDPIVVNLPYGTYSVEEMRVDVDYHRFSDWAWEIDGNNSYNYFCTVSITPDEKNEAVKITNNYRPMDDSGSLSIFTQINPADIEDLLSRGFGFEITGPEGFGENGKRTVLFSDMVKATEEDIERFLTYYEDTSVEFLLQGDWYVYSFYPNPQLAKSRSANNEQRQGYEQTYMPAGEYTVHEIDAEVSGYTRTTESFNGYFVNNHIQIIDEKTLQTRKSDPMVQTIGVAKDYDALDAYVGFINNYEQTPDIPDTPTPTPTPEPTPPPEPTEEPETVDVTVEKVWKDDDESLRPASITVILVRNGEDTENTATLNAENSWKYTWTGLEKLDAEGVAYVYTVREDSVPEGYTVSYGGNAESGLTVINTGEGTINAGDDDTPLYGEGDADEAPLYNPYGVPGTGDNSHIILWSAICAACLAAIAALAFGKKRRKEN